MGGWSSLKESESEDNEERFDISSESENDEERFDIMDKVRCNWILVTYNTI